MGRRKAKNIFKGKVIFHTYFFFNFIFFNLFYFREIGLNLLRLTIVYKHEYVLCEAEAIASIYLIRKAASIGVDIIFFIAFY